MTRIRGFDGVRALAVIAVFMAHRSPLSGTEIGHAGVLLFFALSGYLIVGILHRSRLAIEGGAGIADELRGFFVRRSLRIFPIYYLVLAGMALFALAGLPHPSWRWDAAPWHFLYLSNLYAGHVLQGWQGSFSHLWTLAVEEQFYLLAAPLLLALPSRHHLAACLAIAGLGVVSGAVLVLTDAPAILYTGSLLNFGCIALGGAARLYNRPALPEAALWGLGIAVVVVGLSAKGSMVSLAAMPVLATLLILGLARAQEGRLAGLLEAPPLVLLGRASYGFYLYHNLFWLGVPIDGPVGTLASMALNFTASVGLAVASHYWIERPIMGLRVQATRSLVSS